MALTQRELFDQKVNPIVKMLMEVCTESGISVHVACCIAQESEMTLLQKDNTEEMMAEKLAELEKESPGFGAFLDHFRKRMK